MNVCESPADIFAIKPQLSNPIARLAMRMVRGTAESALALPRLERLYVNSRDSRFAGGFCDRVLDEMQVRVDVDDGELARIPTSGPTIIAANHPFGGLDGIVLGSIVGRVRPDLRVVANPLLGRVPELREFMFFVDPFGGVDAVKRNIAALRQSIDWLKQGKTLVIFPAGEVSHYRWKDGCITDPPWNVTIARLVQRTGAAVVPAYFQGSNSRMFQMMGLIHPRLRTAMLPRELLNKYHAQIQLNFGAPISGSRLARIDDPRELTDYLRLRTYILRSRVARHASVAQASENRTRMAQVAVGDLIAGDVLASELATVPESCKLVTHGEFDVYCATREHVPKMVEEIGRQREIAFRAVGEGTGRAADLDSFDDYYEHLFVWNREKRELVGAYRMGRADEIVQTRGIKGLYSSTLFRFDPRLMPQLGPALELGRSFVVPKYQRSFAPLMLLWKGIGHFVAREPRYRMLFGAVSISAEYDTMTKRLIMSFLQQNAMAPEVSSALALPRHPPKLKRLRDCEGRLPSQAVHDIGEVDDLVREIESANRTVPILLKQYLRLNGKLLAFNIDPDFGHVMDGLILIDLTRVDRPTLDRYFGRESAGSFLEQHAGAAAR